MPRLAQYGFSGGEIGQQLTGRVDIEKYALSLRSAKNCTITKYGGVQNRAGTEFIGEVRDSSHAVRITGFEFNTTQNYVQEWGNATFRPIKDEGQVLQTAVAISGGITQASPGVVTAATHGFSNGDKVFPAAIGGMVELLDGRVFTVANSTANTFTLVDLWGNAVDTSAYTAYTSGGTFSRLYQLTVPYASTEVFDFGYAQTADTMLLAHLGYAPRKLTRSGHANWSISSISFGPVQAAPTSPSAAATVGSGATTYSYKITAIDDDTGEESLPSSVASVTNDLTTAGNYNTVSWVAASGAERYIVYKAESGVYGLIGGTTGTSFIDDNILPDLGDTPPGSRNPFGSSSNYPCRVEFHEGRSWWGQTINTPGGVWSSNSNLYYNMNVASPAKSDDSITIDIRPGVNAVVGLASVDKLAILTANAEYTLEGGGVTEYLTPSSIVLKRRTARGSRGLRPIVIGKITLYVQRQGAVIRALGYSFQQDDFKSNDLTLLAPHLFRGHTIVDWCYQQDPDSIVWCVRDDGVVLALTFVEDQNTFAWTPLYLGGTFGSGASATGFGVAESCCSIEGDEQDDVYFVVKRTINGQTKRYIEKLATRWSATFDADDEITNVNDMYFLDCGVVGASVSGTTVKGLWHLEAQSVYALGDGSVQGPFTVASGRITLDTAATTVHVGLAYTADIIDLPITQQTQTGAPQGRWKGVNNVVLKLNQTRGVKVGDPNQLDKLVPLKSRGGSTLWDDPIAPGSGDTDPIGIDGAWSIDGSVIVRQAFPLPVEVLMIAKDVVLGGP